MAGAFEASTHSRRTFSAPPARVPSGVRIASDDLAAVGIEGAGGGNGTSRILSELIGSGPSHDVPPEGFEPPTYGTGNRRSIP